MGGYANGISAHTGWHTIQLPSKKNLLDKAAGEGAPWGLLRLPRTTQGRDVNRSLYSVQLLNIGRELRMAATFSNEL